MLDVRRGYMNNPTVQSSKHWHLGRKRLLLWTKNALREKALQNMAIIQAMPERKHFFRSMS